MSSNNSIVMAGVVPPPLHGQSMATKALFDAKITEIDKHVVEIRSSKSIKDVGNASLGKVFGLFPVIARVLKKRFQTKSKIFYYTAGSAALVPFVRDIILLGVLRPFFHKTLIHYHSGGLPDFLETSAWKQSLGKWIYGRGAWAISLNKYTAVPGITWGAEKELILPNGLDVDVPSNCSDLGNDKSCFNILFLGNLHGDKGIFDLLNACKSLANKTERVINLQFVGKWPNDEVQEQFSRETKDLPSNMQIPPPQARYGEEKWLAYSDADLFAFPTFYRAENLPLVVIEAMAMSLPVVATRWRGLPSQVIEKETGWLVNPRCPDELADVLLEAVSDPDQLARMGAKGRAHYEANFTMDAHISRFSEIVISALQGKVTKTNT